MRPQERNHHEIIAVIIFTKASYISNTIGSWFLTTDSHCYWQYSSGDLYICYQTTEPKHTCSQYCNIE